MPSPGTAAIQVAILLSLSFVIGRLSRAAMRANVSSATRSPAARNIGASGRVLRLALAALTIVLGIVAWQPIVILFGGLTLYEAASGWCWLNGLTGRDSCDVR